MRNKRRFIIWSIITVVIMLIIFILSAQPAVDSQEQSDFVLWILHKLGIAEGVSDSGEAFFFFVSIRKIAHMSLYFALGFAMNIAVYNVRHFRNSITESITLVCSYIYACLDELHQTFVPGRAGMISDTMIDLIGIVIAILILTIYRMYKNNHRAQVEDF